MTEHVWREQSKEVKNWMMDGKRCLLISGWVGLNSWEKPCLNLFQIFTGSNQSIIKRYNFVTGLNLPLNCETAINLCVSKAHLSAQSCVENWGYSSLQCVFSSLAFLHHLPVDTNWKALHRSANRGLVLVVGIQAGCLWGDLAKHPEKWMWVFHVANCLHPRSEIQWEWEAKHRVGQLRWWSLQRQGEVFGLVLFSE